MPSKTAYVTGGASGIGEAVTEMLAKRGVNVCIADQNFEGAQEMVHRLKSEGSEAMAVELNATDWDSQVGAFQKAVDTFGHLDYVFPIAGVGERKAIRNDSNDKGWQKPDLTVIDVDLTGVLYTTFLAIQQMRRQEKGSDGLRGRIAVTASVCGFYCVPTVPIYTSAKHGVVGFVRSYGKYLPEESMTLNAVCPNVVRTKISTDVFYDKLEADGILTPMKGVVDAFESFLDSDVSAHLDKESATVMDRIYDRAHVLHEVEK